MSKQVLIDVDEVAARLNVSASLIWKLHAEKKMPQGILVASCRRWNSAVIDRWIRQGCPDLAEHYAKKSGRRAAKEGPRPATDQSCAAGDPQGNG